MEKRRQIKKETQKKRKKNIINKSINLNSDSDSEDRNPNESNRNNKIIHQRKNKINNNDIPFNKNNNNK